MIIVDPRSGGEKPGTETTVDKLVTLIRRNGIECTKEALMFGDFAFEGNGPDGERILIGVERKSLHDMLNCIDDARFAGHQKVGMKQMYKISFLALEGNWRPHDPDGWLMEGFNGGQTWTHCKYRSQRTLYAKLFRYLLSIQISGVIITHSRDLFGTAYNVCEIYNYFQKRWEDHTSLLEIAKLKIPDMNHRPSLVRRWASDLDDIGVKMSHLAEQWFESGQELANSSAADWLRIPGVGLKTAQKIVKQIRSIRGR